MLHPLFSIYAKFIFFVNVLQESKGEVSYGLFYGTKDLNPGFGVRSHSVDGN